MIPQPFEASIVFYVSDIERTERFYRDVLGLPVERQEGAPPFWLTANITEKFQLIFFQQEGKVGSTPAVVFSIQDGGIDDIVAGLVANGVTIVTPVSEAPGGWSADFLDPDGFGLGLWQPGDKPRSKKN
ncbi:MAG: VOC family protein [Bauldia sp.]